MCTRPAVPKQLGQRARLAVIWLWPPLRPRGMRGDGPQYGGDTEATAQPDRTSRTRSRTIGSGMLSGGGLPPLFYGAVP